MRNGSAIHPPCRFERQEVQLASHDLRVQVAQAHGLRMRMLRGAPWRDPLRFAQALSRSGTPFSGAGLRFVCADPPVSRFWSRASRSVRDSHACAAPAARFAELVR
jgi:hypothetical protein